MVREVYIDISSVSIFRQICVCRNEAYLSLSSSCFFLPALFAFSGLSPATSCASPSSLAIASFRVFPIACFSPSSGPKKSVRVVVKMVTIVLPLILRVLQMVHRCFRIKEYQAPPILVDGPMSGSVESIMKVYGRKIRKAIDATNYLLNVSRVSSTSI